jgi:hypothetical protein
MNGNEPATKQDITDLKSDIIDLRTETQSNIEQLRAEANHQYNDLLETIRDSETKLLQAFYGYAASNDKRMTQQDANIAVFLSRMSTFETRLLEVEKRLNMPPAA